MKTLSIFTAITLLAATTASANIENIDAAVEKLKPIQTALATPEGAPTLHFASGETCVLPLTLLVEVPMTFHETEDQIALACAVR